MRKLVGSAGIAALLGLSVLAFHWSQQGGIKMEHAIGPDAAPGASSVSVPPSRHYPVPPPAARAGGQNAPEALPSLADSDASVGKAISELVVGTSLRDLFRLQDMVRNIVATIDNLPRDSVAVRRLPLAPPAGMLVTAGAGSSLAIGEQNAARYAPYIRIAEGMSAKELVSTYVELYPLFQRAYQDLGYPQGYFNDRLIAVIDHLLAAPDVAGPIALVQPHVLYRYSDSELEAESAGHKLMLRMGSENAAKLKAKLREIRYELTREAPPK